MTSLPIDDLLPVATASLRANRCLVLVAPPGAGKTTRFPPALLDVGLLTERNPVVVVLQPRRVAARATAARIAFERGCALGEEIGYQIRMDRRIGPKTRIRVVTEGVLTRQLLADPYLEGVGAVVIDEFHERGLHTDLALALLHEVRQTVRDDLILVAMSATLEAEPVAAFLGGCPVLRSQGRAFPVEITYHPAALKTPLHERAATALATALDGSGAEGDVLVFLPGAEEIRRTARAIEAAAGRSGAIVLPLHGQLSPEAQDRALRPANRRKIVLATNLAETSLTIDGVRTVIDTGYARFASVDPARGLDRLELARISRASADQRAGRAGRTAPGRCMRLWAEAEQKGLPAFDVPEVHRVDLAATVLELRAWGVADPRNFGWYEAPPEESLAAAERLLDMLDAIDPHTGRLTELGRRLGRLPLHPRLARLLVASHDQGQPSAGAELAALLSERDVRRTDDAMQSSRTSTAVRAPSDLLARIDLLHEAERHRFAPALRERGIDPVAARHVARTRDDLRRLIHRGRKPNDELSAVDEQDLLRLIMLAYPDRVVRRRGPGESKGRMVGGRGVRLDADSVVREAEFFIALDATQDRRGRVLEARVRMASAIELEWLLELFPRHTQETRELRFDEERERVVAVLTLRYHDLILRESPHGAVDAAEAGRILADVLRPKAVDWIARDEVSASWFVRYECLRTWMPELQLPSIDAAFLGDVVAQACSDRKSLDEVRKVPLLPLLKGRLTHAQARAIDEKAPESLVVKTGNRIRLEYEPARPPRLAVRIQEIFGWTDTPRVADGRVPVLLHLLAPNFRPVQVTDDLRSFWNTTYHQVRKDLRARYPKHSWPEDPWTARAEAKGGRRRSE
jgi:ATP-dependent helicase HrpB